MLVRAKFVVGQTSQVKGGSYVDGKWVPGVDHTITMQPVTGGSPEDKAFFASTPQGKIEMKIVTEAAEYFELGEAYYVTFEKAEPEA